MPRLSFKILLMLTSLLISEQTLALRCGNKLVDIGDHKLKVISLCGEPEYREIREIRFPVHCIDKSYYNDGSQYYPNIYKYDHNYQRNLSNHAICQYRTVDVWIYNFGPRKFMRELLFHNGIIKEINTLSYGY